VFSISDRNRLRDHVLELATKDERVVAGAVIGSLAHSDGDRWSDLDLTFAVEDQVPISEILEDWTHDLITSYGAIKLFDLPSGSSIYRVFLLPGCLQFDLSFTPVSEFGARGPSFRLIFGSAMEKPYVEPPAAHELFGYAVHHALRARFCIERGRYWHAEYWISGVRDYGLTMACRRRNLSTFHGRGFDDLPANVHEQFRGALVGSLEHSELLRALTYAINGLLGEAEEIRELASKVEPQLRALTASWES
jgi:hypothetical protein